MSGHLRARRRSAIGQLGKKSGRPGKTKEHSRAVERVRGKRNNRNTLYEWKNAPKTERHGPQIFVAPLNSTECITTSRLIECCRKGISVMYYALPNAVKVTTFYVLTSLRIVHRMCVFIIPRAALAWRQ